MCLKYFPRMNYGFKNFNTCLLSFRVGVLWCPEKLIEHVLKYNLKNMSFKPE